MRVNIEDTVRTDPRFITFSRLAKKPLWFCVGAMYEVWYYCQQNNQDEMSLKDLEWILKSKVISGFMIESSLLEITDENLVRVVGMAQRLEEIATHSKHRKESGRLGGLKRSKRLADAKQTLSKTSSEPKGDLKQNVASMSMSMSMSLSKSMSDLPSGEEKIREQSPRVSSPKLSTNEISDVVDSVLSETEFVESEVVKEKPKRKKKAVEISDHDRDLGQRWYEWTVKLSPHINATPASFSAAIFETKRALARTIPDGDLNALIDAIFDFIQKDKFWSKNCLSPGGLLKKSSNDLRKIDNVITAMRGYEFQSKRNDLILENSEPMDMSWMIKL